MKAAAGLSNMTYTQSETGTDLGGLTLLPGVYNFADAASLDGILTLNANNEPNAVWVFQIGSSLTTAGLSSVVLENIINNGSGVGIYWDAKAAITIGADNTILGNYLAGSSITLDGNDSNLGGRLLAEAAVTIATTSNLNATGDPGADGYDYGLMYNGSGDVVYEVSVPEPAAFLWLAPLGAMGLACWRRRLGLIQLAS
jgi:type VI secretion system secreted protein VgrG